MADLPWALDTESGKAGAGEGENQLAEEEEKGGGKRRRGTMRLCIPDELRSSSCGSRWLSSFLSCEATLFALVALE